MPALLAPQIGNGLRGKPFMRRWDLLPQKRHCAVF
jgi:hypothetical protein